MRLQDVLTVLAVAAATLAGTTALLAPRGLGAGDPAPGIVPVIAQPRLASQGCEFVVRTDKAAYQAGESPTLLFAASNPTEKTVEATVWIDVQAAAPSNPMARMLPVPKSLWSHKHMVSLKPGETRTDTIATDAGLPAGQSVSITISDKERAIVARSLSVPGRPNRAAQAMPVQERREAER